MTKHPLACARWDELRSSRCRIADVGSGPPAWAGFATAPGAASSPKSFDPNLICGEKYSPDWDDCVGVVTYPHGNVYRREFHHGVREGFGLIAINVIGASDTSNIRSSEPAIYAGEFRDDHLNGRGILVTKSGIEYSGTYRGNIAQPDVAQRNCVGSLSPSWDHCVATVRYSNGNLYSREFVNGLREGIGMSQFAANGAPDATNKTPMPGFIVGEFKGDRLNGRGMILIPGAGIYGTFKDNVIVPKPLAN